MTYHHHPHLIAFIIIGQSLCTNSFSTSCHANNLRTSRVHSPLHIANSSNNEPAASAVRLNKVFKATHSRREADKLIESGRVCINNEPLQTKGGIKVVPFRDVVTLDGTIIHGWEEMNAITQNDVDTKGNFNTAATVNLNMESFEYVKYFKPLGVTCTCDLHVDGNIIDEIGHDGYHPKHRVFPVGRLDKETSGLILLTSDGRMVNSVLRGEWKQPKVYKVMVNGRLEESHMQMLRDGIVITTVAQRKGRTEEENTLVAKTRPCTISRIGPSSCQMTLVEGRNRQIRRMMEALDFRVVKLQRVEFMGIHLSRGLERPGDWDYLNGEEMGLVEDALRLAREEKDD